MLQLDEVLRGYLLEKGYNTEGGDYQRMYQIATRGLKDLHYDITGTPITVSMSPNKNGVIELPSDFLNLVSIGVVNNAGEIINLGHQPNLAPPTNPDNCGTDGRFPATATPSAVNNSQYFDGEIGSLSTSHINAHGESIGRYYGAGGRVGIGQYSLKRDTNQIITANLTTNNLVVQYLSSIGKEGKDFIVHEFAEEPLFAYLEWKRSALKTTVPRGEKIALMQEYYRVKMNLRIRLLAKNTQVISQYSRKNDKAIKF
jgi:hypothetical protein|tara:strand:+ start:2055 stop:2825 length:771 start_codon:yes stop_codon:yes gene_type:complete